MSGIEQPMASGAEEAVSAAASDAVLMLLLGRAADAETLIGAAAVMSGALDGVARYVCSVQINNSSADEVADAVAGQLARFVALRHQPPAGHA